MACHYHCFIYLAQVQDAPQSPVHKEVAALLRKLRVKHEAKRPTRDGLVSIDIALQPTPTRFVALQIIGNHEMMVNTGKLTGPVLYQRQLLEKNGWEVRPGDRGLLILRLAESCMQLLLRLTCRVAVNSMTRSNLSIVSKIISQASKHPKSPYHLFNLVQQALFPPQPM